ncbi:MAG: M24 family metallopeptidase, partial [Chloroflexota bacterium]
AYSWDLRKGCLELPFPAKEYQQRLRRTRRFMTERDLEALIICGDPGHVGDLRWLTNWRSGVGNAFLFLPSDGDAALVLHDEVPSYQLCTTWVREIRRPARGSGSIIKARDDLLDLIGVSGVRQRLGLVGEAGLPIPIYLGIREDNPRLDVEDVTSFFALLRAIKSALEIDKIKQAVRQSDGAMHAAIDAVAEGVSEKEVVGQALEAMFASGAEDVAFMPLVVAGRRTTWKHAAPTDRPIQRSEPVYIDLGAAYRGYHADISRTVLLGEANAEQENALEFALAASKAVKEAAQPGIPARRLREVGNEVAERFGLSGRAWGTGHGIGCKLREEPLLDPTNELLLQPGMTIAIEPMCVCELGTFVVEDDILITEHGSEYLSHTPRPNWA